MFRSMKELCLVSVEAMATVLQVAGLKNPVKLAVLRYERGAVVTIPWSLKDSLGAPDYTALKAVLREQLGHVEMRTEPDPRFVTAARARSAA